MRLLRGAVTLSYCTNVHPGESLAELEANLRGPVSALRERVCPGLPFGVGLWLPQAACQELSEARRREAFGALLEELGLFAFSINAFPVGGFHQPEVKREVYRPSWGEPARRDYSIAVADSLAALLPEGALGTISTIPLSYKAFLEVDQGALPRMIHHLVQVALRLDQIRRESGRELVLCLEPEPLATLETCAETIEFFKEGLFAYGPAAIEGPKEQAEALLRRHIGLCFDACHQACEWEDLPQTVKSLSEAGIRIGKAQLSVAPELQNPAGNTEGRRRLREFIEPRYLHQTIGKDGRRVEDLGLVFEPDGSLAEGWRDVEALRTHFHVPIFWRGDEFLSSTRPSLDGLVPALLAAGCTHYEVETYSWAVIPEAERAAMGGELVGMLAREMQEAIGLFA